VLPIEPELELTAVVALLLEALGKPLVVVVEEALGKPLVVVVEAALGKPLVVVVVGLPPVLDTVTSVPLPAIVCPPCPPAPEMPPPKPSP
jgi:hypothetical protein